MRHAAAILFSIAAATASAQQLSDADIESAIRLGATKNIDRIVVSCRAVPSAGKILKGVVGIDTETLSAFRVSMVANLGRVALLATDAQRLYQPFTIADVPESIKAEPAVYVLATPDRPATLGGRVTTTEPIERIVLQGIRGKKVYEPSALDTEPKQLTHPRGGTLESATAIATFPYTAINDMRERQGFDVVVVSRDIERRCYISDKDRRELFKPLKQ